MKKNIGKVLSLVLVIVLCFSFASVFAFSSAGGVTIPSGSPISSPGLTNLGGMIIGALQTIAGIVAVAVLIFVGIKYLLASPGEKANIKGSLIPYVIGAVLIFAAVPILGIIQQITSGLATK